MNRYTAFFLVSALVVAAGCGPEEGPEPDTTASRGALPPGDGPALAVPPPQHKMDIGDVEAQVRVEVVPEFAEPPANVDITLLADSRDHVNLVTVDVTPPHPPSFPLLVRIASDESFYETPVVLRGGVYVELPDSEEIEIDRFHYVLGEDAQLNTEERRLDLADHIKAPYPATVLVVCRVPALLMPPGTDEEAIDPETAEVDEVRRSVLLSNPLRINFGEQP